MMFNAQRNRTPEYALRRLGTRLHPGQEIPPNGTMQIGLLIDFYKTTVGKVREHLYEVKPASALSVSLLDRGGDSRTVGFHHPAA
jgi:hypothetical protein